MCGKVFNIIPQYLNELQAKWKNKSRLLKILQYSANTIFVETRR